MPTFRLPWTCPACGCGTCTYFCTWITVRVHNVNTGDFDDSGWFTTNVEPVVGNYTQPRGNVPYDYNGVTITGVGSKRCFETSTEKNAFRNNLQYWYV